MQSQIDDHRNALGELKTQIQKSQGHHKSIKQSIDSITKEIKKMQLEEKRNSTLSKDKKELSKDTADS